MFLFCFDVSPAGIFLPHSNATTNEAPKAAVNGLSEDGNRRSSLAHVTRREPRKPPCRL